ncbi:hypothetical protein QC761_302640 [Podospora bellae-mahoneyi]|uniref:Amidase domain-containing protein n=1 Tax=Podospora bellae-mahoneyi TaxID=2093777 RepID=A0ABR0FLD8_9PEZI|nr:hypothetical protein QC761_302640 [Podospora bellae-mahoneyi]
MSIQSSNWQTPAEKRKSLLASIRDDWKLSPEDLVKAKSQRDITGVVPEHLEAAEASILAKNAPDIVSHVKDGTYSALQVTTAFCDCLHELFFDQALERAKALHAGFKETGTVSGPLYGLPISLKDQFHIKDVYTTMG